MEQVLATFGLILFFNEAIRIGFGPAALYSDLPPALSGFVEILPDTPYPAYRLGVIAVGLMCALAIHLFVSKTRIGAMVRAGANNPEMTAALGINIKILFRLIFATGACLAGVAGMMLGPLTSVQSGHGRTFADIVFGGDYHWRYRVGSRRLYRRDHRWACRYAWAGFSAVDFAAVFRTGNGRWRGACVGLNACLYLDGGGADFPANRPVSGKRIIA